MAAYTIKVEADLTGTTAVGAARTWTDVTTAVLSTGIGSPIEIENWRPDQWTDVSPSTMDIVVDNSSGTYKPGATGIKPLSSYWRVSATISGVQTFLFDGVLASAVAGWVDGVKAITRIRCVDILALFGERTPLRSMFAEELNALGAAALFELSEDNGATSAGDRFGRAATAVVKASKYGAGTVAFGADMGPTIFGSKTGASFTSADVGSATTTARGSYLSVPNILGSTMNTAWSIGVTLIGPSVNPAAVEQLIYLPPVTSPYGTIDVHITTAGTIFFSVTGTTGTFSATHTTNVCDGKPHQVVLTMSSGSTTLILSVDGVGASAGGSSINYTPPPTCFALGLQVIAGTSVSNSPFGGTLANFWQLPGVAVVLGIQSLYSAQATGFTSDATSVRIGRLLTYRANFGSSIDTGVGLMCGQDTDGVTLADALLACGKAELGVVYVDGSAQVIFRSRSRLFNPATALTLDATKVGEVTPDVEPRIDTQGVVNDATISRPTGADQRAFDQTSINLYGTNDGSDTRLVYTDQAALDIANDLVAQNKTPLVDTQSVTCDLNAITTVATAQSVLARAPLDRVTVANLPTTSPAIDGIVQGRHVTIGADKTLTITFNLSPLRLPVMVADDATFGVCDTVNVAAF